jgi:hypothetical protein
MFIGVLAFLGFGLLFANLARDEQSAPIAINLCVFRRIPISDSNPFRSPIPTQTDHGFRTIPIANSEGFRSAVPRKSDHGLT